MVYYEPNRMPELDRSQEAYKIQLIKEYTREHRAEIEQSVKRKESTMSKNEIELFRCQHIDDFAPLQEGFNAVTKGCWLRCIEHLDSKYKHSTQVSHDGGKTWEYMGLGHTGGSSLIFGLLKQIQQAKAECEELKEKIKKFAGEGKRHINEKQDLVLKYECHQKSLGMCWRGKYGKEKECIGIKECHKRELEVIEQLQADNARMREGLERLKTFTCKDCPNVSYDEETGEQDFCEMCCKDHITKIAKQALEENRA